MTGITKCSSDEKYATPITKASFHLSKSEEAYVEQLQKFGPLHLRLSQQNQKEACKALGQKIFNRYKREGGSEYAFFTAVRIFTALAYNSQGIKTDEWTIFRNAVAKAWNGIGDSTGRWTA